MPKQDLALPASINNMFWTFGGNWSTRENPQRHKENANYYYCHVFYKERQRRSVSARKKHLCAKENIWNCDDTRKRGPGNLTWAQFYFGSYVQTSGEMFKEVKKKRVQAGWIGRRSF